MAAFTQTFPVMPIPSLPALMATAASRFPQVYQNLPVFPGMPLPSFDLVKRSAFTPPPTQQQFHKNTVYTQAELDMLLYGYGISKSADGANHALSGLRVSQFGAEKMVGGNKHPRSIQTHTVDDNIHLPDGVVVHQSTFAGLQHSSTFTTKALEKGHRFGPFQGKKVYTSEIKTNDGNSHMWEIFTEGKLQCFIDGRGSNGNWMAFVNCARYPQEQNLDAVQVGEEIFYQASKEIPAGKELLVWYGDSYNLFMGIPIGLKDDLHKTQEATNQQVTADSVDANGYSCERCGKVFAYKYYKDKHLKYTRCVDQGDRKFPCNLCSRSFEKRDRLRIHILHVHEKHRPHKCNICNKCFSQSSSLNKHMRVHSGERPYKCVYCNKAFTASSILRTHIRQHSGEKPFKCKFCGKAFASHAAHDSHVRRTHAKEKSELPNIYNPVTPKGSNFTARDDYYFHVYDKGTQLFNTESHSLCSSPAYSTMSSLQSDDDSITGNATGKREEIDVVG